MKNLCIKIEAHVTVPDSFDDSETKGRIAESLQRGVAEFPMNDGSFSVMEPTVEIVGEVISTMAGAPPAEGVAIK